ncbi:hypothetical protein EV215_1517 [Hypnocyclicus thermotrophus]|uniref:Ribosomal processing cysteine protease Prp n=1 Tax=Hypnocyclicus thermotrophus TaxID=1627895 RepID=A0AA46DYC9_9FUSO|nr:ribosomal-processing cysteine protease Prp [Hypnocyclicus thermotrophus]TDT69175.1 hypothetical protein EV215_1517 [Hypnocyclicus thermotrophus]
MTKFTIVRKNYKIIGFYGEGHSGYANSGEDIVCSAISAISQQSAIGITEYLKIPAAIKIDEDTGYLKLDISSIKIQKKVIQHRKEIDAILESMCIMLKEIEKQYPKFLKVVEKEAN